MPRMYQNTGPVLFPIGMPGKQWAQFTAAGFTKPVCGVVYRRDHPVECGVPLGVIDTGYLNLDADGTFGFCSLFGSFVPPRGPLRQPFLGVTVGKRIWVLATRYTEELENIETTSDIRYWGHYPVADLEYETDAPVSVGLRAWTPFIPGDVAISNTPGAMFEVHLRNASRSRQQGALTFSFPGPTQAEAQISPESARERVNSNWFWALEAIAKGAVQAERQPLQGNLRGISVTSPAGVGYTLAVLAEDNVQIGANLGSVGNAWQGKSRPKPQENDFGTSLTVDFGLDPAAEKTIRFVLAWYAPLWKGEGSHCFTHMYATRYPNSLAVAQLLARDHTSLLRRVLNWQQAIYTYEKLPAWLQDTLVNNLYAITKVSLWAAAKPPLGDWCHKEDGLFGMNESPRECPQMECIPCSFYGNIPIVSFFPEAALSTLRGYKAYQYPDGAAPWIFGGCTGKPATEGTEMAMPNRGYQTTSNGSCYVDLVDRYWLRTGRDEILREFYPSVKQSTIYTMNLNPGPDGVISMPTDNIDPATGKHATFGALENELWYGRVPQLGGWHMAHLKIVERMADKVGDKEFAEQCRKWFKQGSDVMENKMWAGEYYLAYDDPEIGKRSEVVNSYQLYGEWIGIYHGLPGIFRPDRVQTTLGTIKRVSVPPSFYGARHMVNPDGTPWLEARYGPSTYFTSEDLILAAMYMYTGQPDFGLELARRCMLNLMLEGSTWNQPVIVRADTGKRISGYDYYQNMMLWSLPAAVEAKDLAACCATGGLVDQVLQAGKQAS